MSVARYVGPRVASAASAGAVRVMIYRQTSNEPFLSIARGPAAMPIRHATPRVYPPSLRPGDGGGAQTLPTSVFSSLMRGVPESFWPPESVGASMRPDLYCCLSCRCRWHG